MAMEVLSPRSANVPSKSRTTMKKPAVEQPKAPEKPVNPDRIDDKWRPPAVVTEPTTSQKYATGRKLGKGGFAVCFEGHTEDSKVYALKVVKAKVEQKKMAEKFRTELQIHAKMEHPNIVDFLRAFTVDNHTYVVLELCSNGNLTDMVKARSCLSLPEVRRFMIQICGGVNYMHKRNVIHRDLKMGNIFLDAQMNIKIGDFGLAAVMADEQDRRTTLCGTPNYIAPEILSKSGTRGHDNKVDTWAIGVICYAMLMGAPPFQSKTQQEIYAKLRTLEYEWKIDSKNYIPQQAKNFVAACLNLNSAERPGMDDLVEHDFFTMGVVAETLDSSCLKHRPGWLLNADPRGDRVTPGYGMNQAQACKEAGVGRTSDGKPRPGVGGKCNISALIEIEAENQQGTAPTIPLPEGFLYNAFSEAQVDWALHKKYPIQPIQPRSRKPMLDTVDIPSMNAVPMTRMLPPGVTRAVPSFAAQQRQQATGRAPARQAASQAPVIDLTGEQPGNTPVGQGLLRARPVRAASTRTTRAVSAQITGSAAVPTIPKSTTVPSSLTSVGEAAAEIAPIATMTRSQRSTRTHKAAVMQSLSEADVVPARVLTQTSANDRQPPTEITSDKILAPPSFLQNQKPRLICEGDSSSSLPHTSITATLSQLDDLHAILGLRTDRAGTKSSSRRLRARTLYPRVDKWVDYSSKHGIAYILTDGTLGMVIKSSDDIHRPSASVVIRKAKNHTLLRAKGAVCQLVPQGRTAKDIEFYEQSDLSKDMSKCAIPARTFAIDEIRFTSLTAATNALQGTMQGSELERLKELVLLDKFGKYMNKRHDEIVIDPEEEKEVANVATPSTQQQQLFIHFYQRVGNVGVWRFSDGGLQFNFPDHTKITIYQDKPTSSRSSPPEYLVDLVYLEPADALDLSRKGRLTIEALERRGSMTLSLSDILNDFPQQITPKTQTEAQIVITNEVKEKLSWIRAVLGCWIKEGGMGRMGEERLGWSGLQERREPGKMKLTWVTVGRVGGDGGGNAVS